MIEVFEQYQDKIISFEGENDLEEKPYQKEWKRPKDSEPTIIFSLRKNEKGWIATTSYFIGVYWLDEQCKKSIRISSKFSHNGEGLEVDCLKMLEEALRDPKNLGHLDGLIEVEFNKPAISIPRCEDTLSLFLISEYLRVLACITEKGLMKAYYFVEENQRSKIKGKLLLSQSIKKNISRGNQSDNYCRFQEYGVDIPENRLLKKAMMVCTHILDEYKAFNVETLKEIITHMCPKWRKVSIACDERKIDCVKINPFFKEYPIAVHLAKMILRKRAYNQVLKSDKNTTTPPYRIEMSKLFELYVYAKLRERFGNQISYHPHIKGQEPDYLLCSHGETPSYVIDAKYKRYSERNVETEDIRQVCGYARLVGVRKKLGVEDHSLIRCLIIYPQHYGFKSIPESSRWESISQYLDIYKLGIELPIISN